MPTFDFACSECGHRFEQHVPMHATTGPCPECRGFSVKLFTPPSRNQFMFRVGFQYTRSQFVKTNGHRTRWGGYRQEP